MCLAFFCSGEGVGKGNGIVTQDKSPNTHVEAEKPAAEQPVVAANGAEADVPLTLEELAARRAQIAARVKALGWRPFQDVALDVLGRVVAAVDGFLTGLEAPKKKG